MGDVNEPHPPGFYCINPPELHLLGGFFLLHHLFLPSLEGGIPDDARDHKLDDDGEDDRTPVITGCQEHQQRCGQGPGSRDVGRADQTSCGCQVSYRCVEEGDKDERDRQDGVENDRRAEGDGLIDIEDPGRDAEPANAA